MSFFPKPQKLNLKTKIGSGIIGQIYPYSTEHVVKLVKNLSTEDIPLIFPEIISGVNHTHPRILPNKGTCIKFKKPYWEVLIKMPKMERNMDSMLKQRRKEKKFFELREIVNNLYGLAHALDYLHSKKIPHKNIHSGNILFNKHEEMMLSDCNGVSLSRRVPEYIRYVAPELIEANSTLKKKDYYAADVWSLGIIFIEICLLEKFPTTSQLSHSELLFMITQACDKIESKYGSNLADIIRDMIQINPEARSPAKKVYTEIENKFSELIPVRILASNNIQMINDDPIPTTQIAGVTYFSLEDKVDISRLSKLQEDTVDKLYINFQELVSQVSEIREILESQKKITHLYYNFSSLTDMTSKHRIIRFLEKDVPKLSELKDLQLWMGAFTDDQILKRWTPTLGGYPSLKTLHLDFSLEDEDGEQEGITDNGIYYLIKPLKSLSLLRNLHIDFSRCKKVSNIGINYIKEILKDMNLLRKLSLCFSYCKQPSDIGLHHLSEGIKPLPGLRELRIYFSECKDITDLGLKSLKEALKNMFNLESLLLNFHDCNKISDNGLSDIAHGIRNQKLLHHLYLGLNGSNISYQGIVELRDAIQGLVHLENIRLEFSNCSKISDMSVANLCEGIQDLSMLKQLILVFSGCTKISELGLRTLQETLKSMKSLNRVDLLLHSCEGITNDLLDSFKANLHHIPYVTFVK